MKNTTPQKNQYQSFLDGSITSDDLLGKNVIDIEGASIGVSDKIYIDTKTIEFIGISVDKGFLQSGLLIGKEHIERITSYAIFLKVRPAILLKNLSVFDVNGKKVGTVDQVIQEGNKNSLQTLIVKTSMFKKLEIPSSEIKEIGQGILLNRAYKL